MPHAAAERPIPIPSPNHHHRTITAPTMTPPPPPPAPAPRGTGGGAQWLRAALLTAVLLLAFAMPARAVTYIDASVNVNHYSQTYDDHVLLLRGANPVNDGALSIRSTACNVYDAGLTVQGYGGVAAPPSRGTLEIVLTALRIRNSTVTFRDVLPPNSYVRIVGTVANNRGILPVFVFDNVNLRHNVTFIIESSSLFVVDDWVNASIVEICPRTHAFVIDDRSGLFILDTETRGGGNLVRAYSEMSTVVSNNSVLAIDQVAFYHLNGTLLHFDQPMVIANSSLFRITRLQLRSGFVRPDPFIRHSTVTVANSSLYLAKNITGFTGFNEGVFMMTNAGSGWFNLDYSSVATFYGIRDFKTCGFENSPIPATAEQGRGVHVGGFYTNKKEYAGYQDYVSCGFHLTLTEIGADDRVKAFQPYALVGGCTHSACLPANTVLPERYGPTCNCVCAEGTSEPHCAGNAFDPTQFFWFDAVSPTMCAVENCIRCDPTNYALCVSCNRGFTLTPDQECI